MQDGKGQQGSYDRVDAGESAGMPKDATPPSSSPQEHHPARREGMQHLHELHNRLFFITYAW